MGMGLIRGHAYSVLKMCEAQGLRFVQVHRLQRDKNRPILGAKET